MTQVFSQQRNATWTFPNFGERNWMKANRHSSSSLTSNSFAQICEKQQLIFLCFTTFLESSQRSFRKILIWNSCSQKSKVAQSFTGWGAKSLTVGVPRVSRVRVPRVSRVGVSSIWRVGVPRFVKNNCSTLLTEGLYTELLCFLVI